MDFILQPGNTAVLAADAEVDFMIRGLQKLNLFGQEFWLTTTHVSILVVMLFLVVFSFIVKHRMRRAEEVPGMFQNIVEMIVEMLDGMTRGIMGGNARKYRNYIATLFIFILMCNISGLFGLRPPTADFGVTLPLGLITFGIIQFNNVRYNKAGAFTGLFKPLPFLFPINLIGELAVPFSISLRLFGNVLSGTVMLSLLYALAPIFVKIGIPSVLHIYFDLFSGAIQTYVFCMLTMVYVSDKLPEV